MRFLDLFKSNSKTEDTASNQANIKFGTVPQFDFVSGIDGSGVELSIPEKIAIFYTVINYLAGTISRIPLHLQKETEELGTIKLKEDYRYFITHSRPNPYTSYTNWIKQIIYSLCTDGNAYYLITFKGGKVTSFDYVAQTQVKKITVEGDNIYYKIVFDGEERIVNGNELLHFKFLAKKHLGLSPITALRLQTQAGQSALGAVKNTYEKGLLQKFYLKSTGMGKRATKTELDETIDLYYNGERGINPNKPMLTTPEGFELGTINLNVLDAQFLQTYSFSEASICNLYGCPLPILNGTATPQAYQIFQKTVLSNITASIEDELNFKLLFEKEIVDGFKFQFNHNSLLASSVAERIAYFTAMRNMGVYSPNNIAVIEGLPRDPNPEMDKKLTPLNSNVSDSAQKENKDEKVITD